MKRIAIFASGRGSNAKAIIEACERGEIAAEVVALCTDNVAAGALEIAEAHGIAHRAFSPAHFADKKAYETAIAEWLQPMVPDVIALAGYMRLVGEVLLSRYGGRMLNIHPALLPAFPGLHAQRQAIEAGVKVSGCTVHLVDAGMDTGPIITQTAVPVLDEDTEDTLAERILSVEHPTYIRALAAYCQGTLSMNDRKVYGLHRGKEQE